MHALKTFLVSPLFGFLLKLLSGLAAAGFGIFGIGTETRDKNGNLTRYGKIALYGVLVSGLIAGITSVYEFSAGEEKDRQERLQTQGLLLSVQRGIYPVKDVRTSFEYDLDTHSSPWREYLKLLQSHLPQNSKCIKDNAKGDLMCTERGNPWGYKIPHSSRLFPVAHSPAAVSLGQLGLEVFMLKLSSSKPHLAYELVGGFLVSSGDNAIDKASMFYNSRDQSISIRFYEVPVLDTVSGDLGVRNVYSLADFMPGLIAVRSAWTNRRSDSTDIIWAYNMPTPRWVRFSFPYPKQIEFFDSEGITCDRDDIPGLLVLPIPGDVESANIFSGIALKRRTAIEIAAACEPFKTELDMWKR